MIRRLDPRDNVEFPFLRRNGLGCCRRYFRGRKILIGTDRWGRNYIFSGFIQTTRRPLRSGRLRPFEFILEPGIVYKMQVDAPRKSILGDVAAQWRQNVRILIGRFHSAGRWPIEW